MSEVLADKYSPATVVGGRRVSFSRKPHPRHSSPPNTASQPEPTEPQAQDYPRPPPPPTFAAEHGLPVEAQAEHRGAYAVPPNPRGAPSTSPKTSFMHLHKSEVGHR